MSETETLRDEVESLKERVAALERQVEQDGTTHDMQKQTGLDHRDAAVLAELEQGESYGGLEMKRLYQKHTDIRNDKTAKERAKALFRKDIFKDQVYRGE